MARAMARDWAWDADELTQEIVARLQRGERLETRQFLKPVFRCDWPNDWSRWINWLTGRGCRWMKIGIHKDGKRDNDAVDKAFAYVDWLVQLAAAGDDALGIAALPDLQPSYALNTIVTASQRAGSLKEAARAFNLLEKYGYEPDVFTYTALIDVTARSGDVQGAIEVTNMHSASYDALKLTVPFENTSVEIRDNAQVVVQAQHRHVHDADPVGRIQRQRRHPAMPRFSDPRTRRQHI